jgi:hypothetical protein
LFADLWDDEDETIPVSVAMIRREIERRASDPPTPARRRLAAKSLLAACREAPELFSSVVVCPYDSDLGKEGRKALRQLHRQASDDDAQLGVAGFRRSWGYQFEEPPPDGSWIIDLDCKKARPVVYGASRVQTPAYRLKAEGENDVTVTVRGVVTVPGAHGAFKISKQDRDDIVSVAKPLLNGDAEYLPLPNVMALVDRRAARSKPGKPRRVRK